MSKKTIIICALSGLVILAGIVTFLELTNRTYWLHSKTTETIQEAKQNAQKKKDLVTQPTTQTSPSTTPTNSSGTGKPTTDQQYSAPTSSSSINIAATQPNSTDVAISTKLTGYSDGSCKLTVTNGSKTTTQTAPVMYEREFSTCAGFTVPVSTLGAGTWNISLDVTSGNTTATKTATLEVK